ncbi:MAG: ABC transporter ATP-binding protein/permease [Treponema sp.]|jgi:ATP-binding cassette subfamily B protein|nr:ABC transporter ATP-binding protein/permease [Treponema sp.]
MLKLAKYLRPYLGSFCVVVLCLAGQSILELSLPNLMARIVNEGLARNDTGLIFNVGFIMLGITVAAGLVSVGVGFFSSRLAAGFARDMRKRVFAKVESFSATEFDKFSTASLITRCTNDVMGLQMFLMMGLRMVLFAPLQGIGGVFMALQKSVSMSWIIALAVICMLGIVVTFMSIATPKFRLIQTMVDKLNQTARETLNGLMVIRAFGTQKYEMDRFDQVNLGQTKLNLFVQRLMMVQMPFMGAIMNGVTLLIIWLGGRQIANAGMNVGDLMAFMQYTMQIIMSFMMMTMMFQIIPRTAVSAKRIVEVLESEPTITDPASPLSPREDQKGRIEFRNVSFHYLKADTDALTNISFTVEPGKTCAVIGSTGSGKTTITNLLLRFYDVSSGEIFVDGVDIREMTQKELRSRLGFVPQKSVLLSGTVAFNLRYGKEDAGDDEIKEASDIAQASEFVEAAYDKYNSYLAQGGANVSGGQRQRLSIARALAKKPEILVFDDSFSALDFRTDAQLRRALREKRKGVTQLVIAQRVGTIMTADQIIVLDRGKIVGKGTHRELLKTCPEYREIAVSQLPEEELA